MGSIDYSRPSREIDRLVHNHVLRGPTVDYYKYCGDEYSGYTYRKVDKDTEGAFLSYVNEKGSLVTVPFYSKDIHSAYKIAEQIRSEGLFLEITERPDPYNDTEIVVCDGFNIHRQPVGKELWTQAKGTALALCKIGLKVYYE